MLRRSTLFVIVLSAAIGFGLFKLKYEVMMLEKEYRQITQAIIHTEESVSVLKAEWAHLTTPERLTSLSTRYLAVAPVSGAQLVSLEQVIGGEQNYDRMALEQLVTEAVNDPAFSDHPDE